MAYYDGTKLLSLQDINGNKPEVYMVTSNRTGGKTTYFNRLVVNRFLKKNEKFCLLYRFNYELDECADKFFKDIHGLFFNEYSMKSKTKAKGKYAELYIQGIYEQSARSCGYAVALNDADAIKKLSHLLSDVKVILFDEFQSESNHYCDNEIEKFISIHTSLARGQGEQIRYLPVYMMGNPVSIINPYYTILNISSRLKKDTKFLRGDGFVLEQGYNESASNVQKLSGFNRAFGESKYIDYAGEGIYLNDNDAFIEKMTGVNRYLCTLKYDDKFYSLKEYSQDGIIYCDDSFDTSFPSKISVTTNDHNINYVMLKRNELFIANMRYLFERGCFRFKNLNCKECAMRLISY